MTQAVIEKKVKKSKDGKTKEIEKEEKPIVKRTNSKSSASSSSQCIDKDLIEKAVTALLKHHKEQTKKKEEGRSTLDLLGTERPLQVQFGLEVAPVEPSRKPIRVLIPNPIYQVASTKDDDDQEGLEEPDVCLIVKDGSKKWVQEMIEEFREYMGCIKKVLGLDSLRKKHSRFHQKRELLQKYDVFMADDRILPMLTTALGKEFIKAKKLPFPITLTRKEALPLAIQRNLSATYMTLSQGTSVLIRAGNTGMPLNKLVENVVAIAENAVDKIPRKWANIRNITVKTPESTSLPFYHKLPEELLEIAKTAGIAPAFQDVVADRKTKNEAAEGNEEDSPTKRKRDLLTAKSPLVRALKKHKNGSNSEKSTPRSADKRKVEVKTEIKSAEKTNDAVETKARKRKAHNESKKRSNGDAGDEVKIEKETNTSKLGKKKQKKEAHTDAVITPVKKEADKLESPKETEHDFMPSKKYKGSRKGFVFRMGDRGVGYYKDKKPVVDKMMLDALFRLGESQGTRSKSGGKRRGRR